MLKRDDEPPSSSDFPCRVSVFLSGSIFSRLMMQMQEKSRWKPLTQLAMWI